MYRTVRGAVPNGALGTTYIHEHLYVIPNELPRYEDYTLDDIDKSIEEAESFKNAGGNTLVDLAPINYGRSPLLLKKISETADVNIMFVTGFHKEEFMLKWLDNLSEQEIYELLMHEINEGVTSAQLLPGAMKIGTSLNEITPAEKRVIGVAGRVQRETGIPMITHCDAGTMGLEQLDLLEAQGADLGHICLSHADLTKDADYISEICKRGAYVSFDHVGKELEDRDKDRVEMLAELVEKGYGEQICLAGDMGRKKYFLSYGGKPGLRYILTDFKEELLKHIPEDAFLKMISDNPQKVLRWG